MSLIAPIPHVAELFNNVLPNFVVVPPVIQAGHSLVLQGTDFPWAKAHSLFLGWDRHDIDYEIFPFGEIQYGADMALSQWVTPVTYKTITVHFNSYDSYDTRVQIASLGSNSRYQVRARNVHHLDEFGPLTRGPWTNWLYLWTAMSNNAYITLQDGAGSISADVPLQMTGAYIDSSFNTTLKIPATMPPGTYTVDARIDNKVILSTQITVVAPGKWNHPYLCVVYPGLNFIIPPTPFAYQGNQVLLQGLEFSPYKNVTLWMDVAGSNYLGTAIPGAGGDWRLLANWPQARNQEGTHVIFALQGNISVSMTIVLRSRSKDYPPW